MLDWDLETWHETFLSWQRHCPSWLFSRAFTLIELILVMALLAIGATLVAPKMASFFRGRALDQEGQRLLALTHLAQSRAVSEGMPIILWFDAKSSTYGLNIQSGYVDTDDHSSSYALDSTVTLETPVIGAIPVSEQQDEKLGLTDGIPFIRFNPDGFPDPVSQQKIVLRQGSDGALQLVPTVNGLGYEIQPYHADPGH